jgi:hypothetical protein
MAHNANAHKPMILFIVSMAIIGILTLPGSAAAKSGNAGTAAIHDITPMTEIGAHRVNIDAEDYFDIVGILNVLENDRIVVGNDELKPASGLNTAHVALSNTVGVKINRSGEVVKIETIYDDPH